MAKTKQPNKKPQRDDKQPAINSLFAPKSATPVASVNGNTRLAENQKNDEFSSYFNDTPSKKDGPEPPAKRQRTLGNFVNDRNIVGHDNNDFSQFMDEVDDDTLAEALTASSELPSANDSNIVGNDNLDVDKIMNEIDDDTLAEALVASGDIEDPTEGGEQGPEEDNEDAAPVSIEQQRREIQAYLGIPNNINPWKDMLLSFFDFGELEAPLEQFLNNCKTNLDWRGEAKEEIDAPIRDKENRWVEHDEKIDEAWSELCSMIDLVSDAKIDTRSMTKPSGPLNATLTFLWHYPTWITGRPLWGCVFDTTNPSTKAQSMKLGMSRFMRTQNRYPIRQAFQQKGVQWADAYPNWDLIRDLCLEFNRKLNTGSKVIVALGDENNDSIEDVINMDGKEVVNIPLKNAEKPRLRVFGRPPSIKIIRCTATNDIQHVVLASHHSQYFYFREVDMDVRAWHDLLWNAAADMVGLEPRYRHLTYFLRQSKVRKPKRANKYKNSQFDLAKKLRGIEKKSGVLQSEQTVQEIFAKTIAKNNLTLAADQNGSYVGTICRVFVQNAHKVISSPEWRMTEGYDRMFASHVANFTPASAEQKREWVAKAMGKRSTEEWKNSEACKNMNASRLRAIKRPQGKHAGKKAALLKCKQMKDLRNADPATLDVQKKRTQASLSDLESWENSKVTSWSRYHVVWWAPYQPGGLRYEGDGCKEPDDFPYDEQEHPAVHLIGTFPPSAKKAFVVENAEE